VPTLPPSLACYCAAPAAGSKVARASQADGGRTGGEEGARKKAPAKKGKQARVWGEGPSGKGESRMLAAAGGGCCLCHAAC
jgi:hypothetical protein